MDEVFFKMAYAGCHESNLHLSPKNNLFDAIHGFMDDSGGNNISTVGHRCWVLFPGLKRVGFGCAERMSAMHVIDQSNPLGNFYFVGYPGEGYYPLKLIESHTVWSAHFNSSRVRIQDGESVKATLTRLDQHFQAVKDIKAQVVSAYSSRATGCEVVIFKPDLKVLELGKYWVELTGLKTPKGVTLHVGYLVDFVATPGVAIESLWHGDDDDDGGTSPKTKPN
jgi:hypothetical protein